MPPVDPQRLQSISDEDAELYDAVRPEYPDELVDDLVELSRRGQGDSVLEIGCDTGQLTVPLARRGFRIVYVELGENLAAMGPTQPGGLS